MEPNRAGWSRPIIAGFGVLLVLASTGAAVWLAATNGNFIGDDLVGFWMATHNPFATYIAMPLDIHFAPLHRLVTWLIRTRAPMNFGVGLFVLASFHLAGVALLYAILERFRSTPYNWLLVGLYSTHVYLCTLFLWWTAGLHRLPCIAGSLAAVYSFVRFRNGGRAFWVGVLAASELFAFGFFIKAILVPLVLVGVEWCLWRETTSAERRRNAIAIGVAVAVAVFCPAVWYKIASGPARMLALDRAFQLSCQKTSWAVLLASTFGFLPGRVLPVVLGGAVWLAAVVVTLWRSRESARAWVCLVVTVSASVLITCLPFSRFVIFGGNALDRVHRYYFELMAPFLLFTALAFRAAWKGGAPAKTDRFSRAVQGGAAALLLGVGIHSFVKGGVLLKGTQYSDFVKQHGFIGRLEHDFHELDEKGVDNPTFVDADLPPYVLGWLDKWRRQSTLFEAMGVTATFGQTGTYRITSDGAIERVKK